MTSWTWRFEKITGLILRELVYLCPTTDLLKVLAGMASAEINKWLWVVRVYPDLAQDSSVNCTHQLLAESVETACCVYEQR